VPGTKRDVIVSYGFGFGPPIVVGPREVSVRAPAEGDWRLGLRGV
jgi:hypothetical protein